jgi:hypothetical protein
LEWGLTLARSYGADGLVARAQDALRNGKRLR